jgi:hypothetical protein
MAIRRKTLRGGSHGEPPEGWYAYEQRAYSNILRQIDRHESNSPNSYIQSLTKLMEFLANSKELMKRATIRTAVRDLIRRYQTHSYFSEHHITLPAQVVQHFDEAYSALMTRLNSMNRPPNFREPIPHLSRINGSMNGTRRQLAF